MSYRTACVLAAALLACDSSSGSSAASDAGAVDAGGPVEAGVELEVTVHAVFDLPRTAATQGLSATAFDEATRTLFTLQDKTPNIVPITASEDFMTFQVGTPIALTGRPAAAWDGEGLVRTSGGFIAVTNETTPTVERFDTSGAYVGPVAIPAKFADQAPGNKGLESLSLSPSGRFLFTANESALTADGSAATKSRGTTVRILRRDLDASATADLEVTYRTEPLGAGSGGDMGVSELAALSDDSVLVLERGFQSGYGNTVRIFRVAVDVASESAKTLVIDLSTLPSDGVTHPSTQPNPILDNYEALALGPTLPDGRRLLFVTSDDNLSATQVARVLVLAVRGL